jgi:hypothetical protein
LAAVSSLVATVVSAVFAVALLRRWAARGRTPATLWWGLALVQFCLASAALLLGEVFGWTGPVFRVFYLFGAVTNVLWLGLGTVAINARRRVPSAVTGGVVVLTGLLSLRGASGPDPALWWPSVVVALALGSVMLLPSARLVRRAGAAVVVAFTAVATWLVLGADLVAPIPADTLPEGRELFPLAVRGMAVAGNAVGSVIVIVGALASSAHAVWRRPDRSADAGLRDVRVADRSVAAAIADWVFAGRRGARRAGNVVRGNLLIALGVGLAAASALFAYVGSFLGALIGVELTDAETTGHAVGLAVGVVVMYAGFRRTLAPVEDEAGGAAPAAASGARA